MTGQQISHYRIVSELGQGGMGVVYRAQDTKLDRTVALKLLAPHMLASEADRARFYREARAAAALHHPNIATVFEIDEAEDGRPFIAMEFIEGAQLDDGLSAKPLPVERAVAIASQMAEALKAAHSKGIVHRDIKSANVMLTKEGTAKVLDFGLAKTNASTRLTQMGSTVGTIAYMSPEQARGEEVDHRTDLWSLGAVLFEMLTGQLPFPGSYEQAVVYGILNAEPEPVTSLRTAVPVQLEQIVAKSLRKDAARRYQSAADVIADLRSVETVQLTSAPRHIAAADSGYAASRGRSWAKFLVGLLVGAAAVAAFPRGEKKAPSHPLLATVPIPASVRLDPRESIALSPDDRWLLFVGEAASRRGLWAVDLASGESSPLNGTENASWPFWSPDASRIGFFADGKLKIIPAEGGPALVLADAPDPRGASWGTAGEILFSPTALGPLFTVPENGGQVVQVTATSARFPGLYKPRFLPDSKTFVVQGGSSQTEPTLLQGRLGSRELVELGPGADPRPVSSGLLAYAVASDPTYRPVFVRKHDPSAARLEGVAQAVIPSVITPAGHAAFSVTETTIAFIPEYGSRNWVGWAGPEGSLADSLRDATPGWRMRISPDGSLVALGGSGLAVHDLRRGRTTALSTQIAFSFIMAWSTDGGSIYYARGPNLQLVHLDGRPETSVFTSTNGVIRDLDIAHTAGLALLIHPPDSTRTEHELWQLDLETLEETRVIEEPVNILSARVDPQGEFLAYVVQDAESTPKVFIRPFRQTGSAVLVADGHSPEWSGDGQRVYFLRPDRRVGFADLGRDGELEVSRDGIAWTGTPDGMQVHPKDNRLLVRLGIERSELRTISIMRDWKGVLR